MKKKLVLAAVALISVLNISQVNVKANSVIDTTDTTEHVVGELSIEDELANEEKYNLAKEYVENKRQLYGYNSSKVLYERQTAGNWCGPAAAYNAIIGANPSYKGKISQNSLAMTLKTGVPGDKGTDFPGEWKRTMNNYLGANNYEISKGSSYSYSDWRNRVKNSVIWTVDKGYAVIADTKQSPYGTKLHPNYNYIDDRGPGGKPTYHYIAITGYDDTPGNDRMLYSDSHQDFNGRYWTYTTNVAKVTHGHGIVW